MRHYDVSIYHNNDPRDGTVYGYQFGHTVTRVFSYTTRDGDWADPLEHAFELFNIGHEGEDPDDRAVRYQLRRNRLLSKGDVVSLRERYQDGSYGETYYSAVASVGFTPIPPPVVLPTAAHGTTPEAATEVAL